MEFFLNQLYIAFVSFAAVFALGFQSRNVNTGQKAMAFITSFCIGMFNAQVIIEIAKSNDFITSFTYSFSGACGIVCAMIAHKKIFPKVKEDEKS